MAGALPIAPESAPRAVKVTSASTAMLTQAATARTPVRTSPSGHLPMAYSVMHSKPSLKRGQSWCSMLSGA